MRVSRLYVAKPLNVGQMLELDADSAHYLHTVLRLASGDDCVVFNGQGGEYLAKVNVSSRKLVTLNVLSFSERSVESTLDISLGLGIARGERMDFSVQKAVELGVSRITPLLTERCVVQLKGDKAEQRLAHWQKIAQHAAEQCGRTIVPSLLPIANLSTWLGQQQGVKLFLDPQASCGLADLQRPSAQLTLMTGPEGGFAAHEREQAQAAGFTPIRLGPRILRTETASLAALAAVQLCWGDFG